MDRNHLADGECDATIVVLAGADYKFPLLLRWLDDFLRQILAVLAAPIDSNTAYAGA